LNIYVETNKTNIFQKKDFQFNYQTANNLMILFAEKSNGKQRSNNNWVWRKKKSHPAKKSTGFPVPFSSKSLKTKTALFECEKN